MATFKFLLFLTFQLFVILEVADCEGVEVGFYKKTCPDVEAIVKETTKHYISRAPTLAAPLLRMHFHDCFVRQREMQFQIKACLRGFQVIDAAKSALEKECPEVVSCSDTLALAARDAVSLINRPTWPVPLGRREGRVSILSEASRSCQLLLIISLLSKLHLVRTHNRDVTFSSRLYNFSGKGDMDPNMDQNYINHLKIKCKPGDVTTIVAIDPGSFKSFDTHYYTMVSKRRGLFASDAALLTDKQTKDYVLSQLNPYGSTFFKDFGESMIKMGKIGVLTGKAGEIRKHCALRN
ncbi:unnamed protein product [Withania somnifera]